VLRKSSRHQRQSGRRKIDRHRDAAVLMKRLDHNVAILDADITGPSIPKLFGLKERAYAKI
jgi:hypothetical protein